MFDATGAGPTWVPLRPSERRVIGVLVEKAKTTPEYYPMTIAAIAAACNQKSNRDPITNYDQDEIEETLQGLRKKGSRDSDRGDWQSSQVETRTLRMVESDEG